MIITASKIIRSPEHPVLEEGALAIRNGVILAIGPASRIRSRYRNHHTIALDGCVVMPGLINCHTHLELPLLRDQIRAKTLPDWVVNLIRKKKTLRIRDYQEAAEKNIRLLVRTGTTTVGEICTHQVSPAILKRSGLRAVIFRELISMNPLSGAARLPLIVSRPGSLVQDGLSPHAPYTVSENMLTRIRDLAKRKKIALSMHLAESRDEIRLLQAKKNGFEKLYAKVGWDPAWAPKAASPFEYLNRLGLLGPRMVCVHAVHAAAADIALIQQNRAKIAHCPRSNRETGVGKMPLKKMLDAGIPVGLGTDSLASSPSLNLWDEMRYAFQLHRRDGIHALDIFRMATTGGARTLSLDKSIGSLARGKHADLIAVPLPDRNTGDLYADLLRETKFCSISLVQGKILYRAYSR